MTAEEKILVTIKWKEQAVEDCMKWARMKAPNADLNVYKAGLQHGWDKCLSILKLHNLNTGFNQDSTIGKNEEKGER